MEKEKEENLLTIFKKIETELTKIREVIETATLITYDVFSTVIPLASEIQTEYFDEIRKMRKMFQWYAEKQTGRKYT